jgi:hypothetical protein
MNTTTTLFVMLAIALLASVTLSENTTRRLWRGLMTLVIAYAILHAAQIGHAPVTIAL